MTHPFGLLRQSIEAGLTSVKKLSKKLSLPLFPIYVTKIKCLRYRRLVKELSLFKIVKSWKSPWLLPHGKPFVSAVLFGFHGINLFKNLVSRELLRILKNFHFSISKHFDFTFHFSKRSESILISLCTSRKRVKAFFFSLCTSRKRVKAFYFHFSLLELQKPTLAGPW